MKKELLFYSPDSDRLYAVLRSSYTLANTYFLGETVRSVEIKPGLTATEIHTLEFDRNKNHLILIGEV